MVNVTSFSCYANFDALNEMTNDARELRYLNVSHMTNDGLTTVLLRQKIVQAFCPSAIPKGENPAETNQDCGLAKDCWWHG